MKVTVVSASEFGKFGFSEIRAESVTSADARRLLPFSARNPEEAVLDAVSLRTLRGGMQTVFEDGPKRDRRLWLGELLFQARANCVSYRNYGLIKRSLYLLSGTANDQAWWPPVSSSTRNWYEGGDRILDFTAAT